MDFLPLIGFHLLIYQLLSKFKFKEGILVPFWLCPSLSNSAAKIILYSDYSVLQDLFDDGSEETASLQQQQKNQIISKPFKESYISQMLRKTSAKRPTWFIGSDEEFLKSCDIKKGIFSDDNRKISPDNAKNCSKITVSSQVAMLPVVAGRTSVPEKSTSEKPSPIGKHKKIVEPSITPVCTPISDCDDCYKNNQLLPAPSLERLLPIGSGRMASGEDPRR